MSTTASETLKRFAERHGTCCHVDGAPIGPAIRTVLDERDALRSDHVCTPAFCKVGMDFAPCVKCGRRVDLSVAQNVVLEALQEERLRTKAEVERLRDIISPGNAAAYEEGMAALKADLATARSKWAQAGALLEATRAEREALRVELGEMALVLEQQTRTLTREHEQRERAEAALMDALYDCALTYDAAGDLDYLSRAVEAEAALRYIVQRGYAGASWVAQQALDGKEWRDSDEIARAPEERHWQDDADPRPGRAQAAYQAEQARVAEGTVGGVSTISPWRKP